MDDIRDRLHAVATRHLAAAGAEFDASGEQRLRELIDTGAARLQADGAGEAEVAQAEESFQTLLEETTQRSSMKVMRGGDEAPTVIEAEDFEFAMGMFCPGFYPFC